ncbi:MAG: RluA family pseudouridine synthase [Pseudomonadota bacterium]
MFQVGDLAVYPAHGVGKIESVEIKEISGATQDFYIMRILETNMIIMIPVKNVSTVGLREIIDKKDVSKIFKILKTRDIPPDNQTWNRRYRDYMEKIKTGSVYEVSEVLRDLFLLKGAKDLSFGERKIFDTAQTLIVKELSIATKTAEQKIEQKISEIFTEQPANNPTENNHSFSVSKKQEKMRLDAALTEQLSDLSRSFITRLIKNGHVQINNQITQKPGVRLQEGDILTVIIPPPEPCNMQAEHIPLDIIYEDDDILVVNKSAGTVVHPGAGNPDGTLANALLAHVPNLAGVGDERRPGIVHRLDKDTSGCLVVAKNHEAHEALSQQFKERTLTKVYLALVYGSLKEKSGTISLPIGRHPVDRKKMSTNSKNGRPSETIWKVKKIFRHLSLLEINLKTGRTHQIRTHMAAINHPIVGDSTYGGEHPWTKISSKKLIESLEGVERQMLHAWKLSFKHPKTGEKVSVEAPIPNDIQNLLQILEQIC